MKKLIKTLTLVTTGLVVGVVVGRVSKKNLTSKYKTVTIDPNPTVVEIKDDKVIVSQVLLGKHFITEAHRFQK